MKPEIVSKVIHTNNKIESIHKVLRGISRIVYDEYKCKYAKTNNGVAFMDDDEIVECIQNLIKEKQSAIKLLGKL